jgi:polar amino acid transport system permease protein
MDLIFIARLIPALLNGAVTTMELAVLTFGIVLVWGLAVALLAQRGGVVAWLCGAYVQFVRNTPILIQFYVVYFGLPSVGVRCSEFASALLVLAFQNGGYMAEIYRGGLQSVSVRQAEAGRALGLGRIALYRHVILPQVFARAAPSITNQAAAIIKDTAQAGTIAVLEMTKTAQIWLERSGNPYDVFITLSLIYLGLTTAAGLIGKAAERRLAFHQ